MSTHHLAGDERGAALTIAVLVAALVSVIAAGLLVLTMTETVISASYRNSREASYAAEAGLERALHDLGSVTDWSLVLASPPINVTSSFVDGTLTPVAPSGVTLDLAGLTAARQRESDARDGPDLYGADSPEWRLFAHAPLVAELSPPAHAPPVYVVVWVADDGFDGDGDPSKDANGRIVVRSEAFGASGTRRAVEATVGKSAAGVLRLIAWREVR
jgi:hypothetical protein